MTQSESAFEEVSRLLEALGGGQIEHPTDQADVAFVQSLSRDHRLLESFGCGRFLAFRYSLHASMLADPVPTSIYAGWVS